MGIGSYGESIVEGKRIGCQQEMKELERNGKNMEATARLGVFGGRRFKMGCSRSLVLGVWGSRVQGH